jgi:predicted enzyme related to lactoylglutathione lyase
MWRNRMSQGIQTVIYPVDDLAKAKALYTALLGTQPYVDEAYYVGFQVGDQEIGLDPHGHREGSGPTAYHHVDDIEASVAALLANGATTLQEVKEVGGGKRTASLQDPDGNLIGVLQAS